MKIVCVKTMEAKTTVILPRAHRSDNPNHPDCQSIAQLRKGKPRFGGVDNTQDVPSFLWTQTFQDTPQLLAAW